MKRSINFNNGNSLDKSLIFIKRPKISIHSDGFEEVNVINRSTPLSIKERSYKNKVLEFEFGILSESKEDLFYKIDDITEWLTNIKDNRLLFESDDRYYIVKHVEFEDIEHILYLFGKFKVKFICEPFKYKLNESLIELDRSKDINYTGTHNGECNIKIYGSGNIQLTINDETVQINNVNEYVELDSKLLLCLNKDKTSKTREMIGGFLILTRGLNKVSWIGNVSRVTIQPRTAYRWR